VRDGRVRHPLLSSGRPSRHLLSPGSPALDDPQTPIPPTAPNDPPGPPPGPPPGIRAQFESTRAAATGLVTAHVELAKTEFKAIGGQIARTAGLIGAAIALILVAVSLLILGTALFLGEWILGSIGWGVLHGVLAFLAVAMACVLAALGISFRRLVGSFATAAIVGLAVGLVLGLQALNRVYSAIGDATLVGIEPGVRPLVVGLLVVGIVGLLLGLLLAWRAKASLGGAAIGGLVLGAFSGAFTAITFEPQVAAGVGIAVGYIMWMALMGIDVSRTGIDTEALKARFYPTQTIETSKETLEWLQKRMPPGIG
jgi:hypothetical protein